MDEKKLITSISSLIHIFADGRNYILVIKNNEKQEIRNGYHTYFQNLYDVFQEIFTYQIKVKIANGEDKTMEEIRNMIITTQKEIKDILVSFEELR